MILQICSNTHTKMSSYQKNYVRPNYTNSYSIKYTSIFHSVRIGDKRIKDNLSRARSISRVGGDEVLRAGRASLELASNLPGTLTAAFERVNRAAINGRDCDLLGRTAMGPGSEKWILDRLRAFGILFSSTGCAQIRDMLARSLRWKKKKKERNDLDVPRCGFYFKTLANVRDWLS